MLEEEVQAGGKIHPDHEMAFCGHARLFYEGLIFSLDMLEELVVFFREAGPEVFRGLFEPIAKSSVFLEDCDRH